MYNNGSVSNKVRYQDICTDRFVANFAWVWGPQIKVINNSMVKKPPQLLVGKTAFISQISEIHYSFLFNYNVIVNKWIECDTYGLLNHETGKWTGAKGQVTNKLEVSLLHRTLQF